MARRIALFRGLNVGGRNSIPMRDLRRVLETLGCRSVRTYIQSGNAVYDNPERGPAVTACRIAEALRADAGIDAAVQVLTPERLSEAADRNPFAGENGKTVHLFFLDAAPPAPRLEALGDLARGSERWALRDDVFYLHAPEGIGRSRLAAGAEKLLGVSATARNWRTVGKLLAMANDA